MIKVSDYIYDFLAAYGVGHVFVLPGGGCMHLADSLGRNTRLKYVSCLHEQGASIAAAAYAQYTNRLGSALVTTGPGATNAITGAAGAWMESVPLLIVSGQVKRPDIAGRSGPRSLGFQEIGIVDMVAPITKYAVTVMEPEAIRYHMERAVHEATTGRPGPVWLDIPLDVQAGMVDEGAMRGFEAAPPDPDAGAKLAAAVEEIRPLLRAARRPVILAGYGIKLSNAQEAFLALMRRLEIPVLTTWKAIDLLPEDDPLFFGRPGSVGQRGANFIQQNADLLLSIGARLDFGQIAYSHANFARGAKKIVVDVDGRELEKLKFQDYLPVQAGAGDFLQAMLCATAEDAAPDRSAWLDRCREWKAKYPVILPEYKTGAEYVHTYALNDVLSEMLTGDDLIVPGSSGACSDVFMQSFRVKRGQRILNMPGIGAMGFGLPSTIGACIASGGRRTICINGDGGFQLNVQELATVAHHRLPIKYFILNNAGYSSIRATQRNYFGGFYVSTDASSGLSLPDVCRQAAVYGIRGLRVQNYAELREAMPGILADPGPVVCDVMVDPLEPVLPKVSSVLKPGGGIVTRPMEDLFPFLDREEFRSNMIVPPIEES
jgi:acetolactate synthase-1/2/3 large subunit